MIKLRNFHFRFGQRSSGKKIIHEYFHISAYNLDFMSLGQRLKDDNTVNSSGENQRLFSPRDIFLKSSLLKLELFLPLSPFISPHTSNRRGSCTTQPDTISESRNFSIALRFAPPLHRYGNMRLSYPWRLASGNWY